MLTLELNSRSDFGKGSAKKLRKEGFVPAVISSNKEGSIAVSLQKKVVDKIIQNPSFFATIFEVEVAVSGKAKKINVIPTDVAFHPVTSNVLHIDFSHVVTDTVVALVPVKILGADKSVGLKKGGKLNLVKYHVHLKCKLNNIPANIEVNISNFGVGRSLFLSRVELPQGIEMAYDCLILSITGRGRKEKGEDEAAAAAAAAPKVAAPKAAAPKATTTK